MNPPSTIFNLGLNFKKKQAFMEPINHFGFSSNNFHQNLPIRQFSQASRVEEQHHLLPDDDQSPWDLLNNLHHHPLPLPLEDYQFVDSCFSNGDMSSSPEDDQSFDPFIDLNDFLIADHDSDMLHGDEDADTAFVSSLSSPEMCMQPAPMDNAVDDGLQLVHLLLACAEAVGCRDTHLAESILAQIWFSATPFGDSLQRVSYCFATGLKSRLSHLHALTGNCTVPVTTNSTDVTREEKIEAFHLLHRTTPYISFGFAAANEAISHAARGADRLHVIDLGMEHTLQWPSLLRTLTTGSEPELVPKFIRFTGILSDRGDKAELESSIPEVMAEANSLGIEVEFRLVAGPATPAMLTRENLRLHNGETVVVNSVLHLHTYVKESRGSLKTILQSIKKLGVKLFTIVEQDANHNGPFFLGRFLESLHYYSAIFDSLEAIMGRNSIERMKIERNHFGEEIRNIVAFEGAERVERHERADQWRRQLGRAGFQAAVGVKERQAAAVMSLSVCDGYTVGNDQKGHVLLGWKGRPIMLASAWQPSPDRS